jgi:hypothetical protein
LIDLETKDIRDPLAQFNHTLPNSESVWKLVSTLNSSLTEASRLDITVLKGVFETYWPQFQQKFDEVLKTYPETTVVPPRKEKDILSDILESTRGLERRMRAIENGQNHIEHFLPKNFSENLIPISAKANRIFSPSMMADAAQMLRANLDHGATFEQAMDDVRKAFPLSAKGAAEVAKIALSKRNDDTEQ